jgi:hypothetical protein
VAVVAYYEAFVGGKSVNALKELTGVKNPQNTKFEIFS